MTDSVCLLCSSPILRDSLSMGFTLEVIAGGMLDGIAAQHAHALQNPPKVLGLRVTERCALVVEERCGACHSESCMTCQAAADIRSAADRVNHERDLELATFTLDDNIAAFASTLCANHSNFGQILLAEHYRRQGWSAGRPSSAVPPFPAHAESSVLPANRVG